MFLVLCFVFDPFIDYRSVNSQQSRVNFFLESKSFTHNMPNCLSSFLFSFSHSLSLSLSLSLPLSLLLSDIISLFVSLSHMLFPHSLSVQSALMALMYTCFLFFSPWLPHTKKLTHSLTVRIPVHLQRTSST